MRTTTSRGKTGFANSCKSPSAACRVGGACDTRTVISSRLVCVVYAQFTGASVGATIHRAVSSTTQTQRWASAAYRVGSACDTFSSTYRWRVLAGITSCACAVSDGARGGRIPAGITSCACADSDSPRGGRIPAGITSCACSSPRGGGVPAGITSCAYTTQQVVPCGTNRSRDCDSQ